MIAEHLNDAYSLDMRLSGIIYLHPISDNRFTHHATKNLDMFRKLTGEGNLKNVILATTMWGKVTIEEGERREQELKSKFWDVLLAYQATYSRYDGSPRSAKDIASKLLSNNTPFYAQLQEEMGRQKLAIKDTAAGKEVMSEILRMREEHQKQLEEMKILMLRTAAEENKVALAALEQHYKEMLKAMEKVHKDEKMMNENKIRSLTERISQLESRRGGGGGGGSSCVIL
ncbi:hypothetical protein GGS23DRAFT_75711 [Durotheca rogersii]|uniref:uncharacterized protein n=1 Tax=Durotheca rogersii TaxID=419775 RepID=UPI00221F0869|nr:uncharacterized protein GGS23DRAFT_75711 [Durotheca rogersii]KAI5862921.1 hypothetical protein GGS23DRAFT_75711 [Durotheca rogersii]